MCCCGCGVGGTQARARRLGHPAVSGNMPEYSPGVHPGQDLVDWFKDRIVTIEQSRSLKPKDLLNEIGSRWEIEAYTSHLDPVMDTDRQVWQEYVIREVVLGVGDDPSLALELPDPTQYVFRQPFWPDKSLQDKVPPRYVEYMAEAVRAANVAPQAHDKALREFISRNVLAHIVIFIWYQRMSRSWQNLDHAIRLPNCTRASLVRGSSARSHPPRLQEQTSSADVSCDIRDLLMPRVLVPILEKSAKSSNPRASTIKLLEDVVRSDRYKWLRSGFGEVISLIAKERTTGAERHIQRLISDIDKRSKREGSVTTWKTVFKISGTVGIDRGLPTLLGKAEMEIGRESKQERSDTSEAEVGLIVRARRGWKELENAAHGVFPELFE